MPDPAPRPGRDPTDDLGCVAVVELMTDDLEGAMPRADVRRLEGHLWDLPGL